MIEDLRIHVVDVGLNYHGGKSLTDQKPHHVGKSRNLPVAEASADPRHGLQRALPKMAGHRGQNGCARGGDHLLLDRCRLQGKALDKLQGGRSRYRQGPVGTPDAASTHRQGGCVDGVESEIIKAYRSTHNIHDGIRAPHLVKVHLI